MTLLPETHPESKKAPPSFASESKVANHDRTKRTFHNVLDLIIPNVTVSDLLAVSPELRKEVVEHYIVATPAKNETPVQLNLLDGGSEIVIIREDIWRKIQAPINITIHERRLQMADRKKW
ncbi:uncharacterized protein BJ212DRAFT_1300607 [Suillus subaureus]|uniref:Uncharacterized protein n=1 Tax=Suillus subaureus TaxID=48587 RepID=A0A9P7E8A8_9AGAM|nr:uncharacterized protein BJ212DRAFT_1300607 [Suillus subaureus]KAG1814288.1 hypothetical protein BJ212DRAFT_1300607 [Suillus subaureus]